MGRRERDLLMRLANGDDLFAFALSDKPKPGPSGWRRRKAKLQAGAVDDFGEFDRFVLSEAEEACERRQRMTGYAWQVDHMIPLARGGKHAWHNIQVIPAWLNSRKQDRLWLTETGEFARYLPGGGDLLR
jgi:hypothetical protein